MRRPRKPAGYAIYKLLSRASPAGQRDVKQSSGAAGDPATASGWKVAAAEEHAYFEMLRDQAKVENFLAEQIFKNDAR